MTSIDGSITFLCSNADEAVVEMCKETRWDIPSAMIWPLVYWIIGNSMLSYGLVKLKKIFFIYI